MKYLPSHNKGFTLIETLIAIAILGMAIGATFTMAQKSLSSSAFSKNQTTAYFLAAEGVEMVRNIRDNTALFNKQNPTNKVDWLQPFKSECGESTLTESNCVFDINQIARDLTVGPGGVLQYANAIKQIEECSQWSATRGCRLKIVTLDGSATSRAFTSGESAIPSNIFSIFYRKIRIKEVPNVSSGVNSDGTTWAKHEAIVTVTVYWLGSEFTLSETLTNWN
jgi:prepilin-type N-terminal cleavage/methylation domain-containing protein